MRRKVGIGGIKKKEASKNAYAALGKELEAEKIESVMSTVSAFKQTLTEFALKHKDKINSDPEFRQQFHSMCISVGVDPIASSKGFWADLLGVGDFYYEIGVKVIQISLETRSLNGGLVPLNDIMHRIQQAKYNTQSVISKQDVKRSIEKLSILQSGFRLLTLGQDEFLLSVPFELNTDGEELLDAAQHLEYIEESFFIQKGWSEERFHMTIIPLLHEGIAWVDEYQGKQHYYFPSKHEGGLEL
jgi:ESCRT-II complex subunit VPS22